MITYRKEVNGVHTTYASLDAIVETSVVITNSKKLEEIYAVE